jgi:hypothetical protein
MHDHSHLQEDAMPTSTAPRHTAAARQATSQRAEALATRLETGAAMLIEFAETIMPAEWTRQVGGRDDRTIGVIIHHVATVYPIEVSLARIIASGKPVAGFTWEALAEANAQHARDHAAVTKDDTLALLRANSREAAAEVRRFTDEELDTAAPFSLSFDAPMTAQFVLEDHAVRHSWHHLARIRAALGR